MASLLFEGSDNFKISTWDTESGTIKISMENGLSDAEYSLLQINLSADELKMLSEWIDKEEYKIRELKKNNCS